MTWRNVASAGAVVGLCGGVLVAGSLMQAESGTRVAAADAGTREFLRSARLACPTVVTPDDRVAVAAASIPGVPGQDVPGEARIESGQGKTLASLNQPGGTVVVDRLSGSSGAVVAGDGGLAPGLVASGVTADPRGEGKGLSSAPCLAPGAEAWLLGGGASPGQRSVLHLTNPTESDTLVDVTAFGKGGRLELSGDEGVNVPAGEIVTVRLDALAPRTEVMALRVRTRVGLVTAVVSDERMNGLTPMGAEIILPAGEPRKSVVLAGMPAGAGSRELHLLAPEGGGAVTVAALTENGPLPLLAGEPVPVKEGALVVLDLTEALGGRAAALQITGDVPVVAAAMATTAVDESVKAKRAAAVAAAERALEEAKGDAERTEAEAELAKAETANAIEPGEDFASFGAAVPIDGRSAVTGLSGDLDTTLLLTGTGGAATVKVALLPANQNGAALQPARTIEVADDTTVAVPLKPEGRQYSVVVERASGPGRVHVGHVQLDDGKALTGYAMNPLSVWVPLDPAQPVYAD